MNNKAQNILFAKNSLKFLAVILFILFVGSKEGHQIPQLNLPTFLLGFSILTFVIYRLLAIYEESRQVKDEEK